MSDLISREELLCDFERERKWFYEHGEIGLANGYVLAMHRVNDFPAVDAVPVVHARWVHEQRYGDSGGWVWRCTACRGEAISPIISALHYCHHCGAKMDGGAE